MVLTKLTLQEKNRNLPTQLDFLEILNIRGSSYFESQKKLYKSLKAGYIGEQKVYRYLEDYGLPGWSVLQNVWLQAFDRFECDLLLLTYQTVYLLEIKNYKGTFHYDNGKCYYDSKETSFNPIEQARKSLVNLKQICANISPNIQAKAAVIFAGEDHEVFVQSAPADIKIVTSNGLRNFILNIVKTENTMPSAPINTKNILQKLNQHEIKNPFQPTPLTHDEMKEVKPGIYCAHCHSFDVKTSKFKVICACGLTESREEAIVRTICDYGVLKYDGDLTCKELLPFFAGQVSRNLLFRTLHKHFTVIEKGKYTYCLNQQTAYEKISAQFHYTYPRIFQYKDGSRIIL